jgi:hypothetical protein
MIVAFGVSYANATDIEVSIEIAEERLSPEILRLKMYSFSLALGLVLGFVLVWWISPTTNQGAMFIVAASTICCLLVSAVANFVIGLFRRR